MTARPYTVQSREQFEHNTDPQRRCYDGCHFSSEWRWTEWRDLGSYATMEEAEESARDWRDYAAKYSKPRRLEYRVKPIEQENKQCA
jgi:hypothetical protein